MKVLLIGNGAREHIIAEKIANDAELYSIMSQKNPGISSISKKHWICNIEKPEEVVKCIEGQDIDVAFASPDAVLAAGVSDALEKQGITLASPNRESARIEWDKKFMRDLVKNYKISGAIKFEIVEKETDALRIIKDYGQVALKPIGLTGGKGVRVSGDHFSTPEQGMPYVREVLRKDGRLLIEEKIEGEEFSLQAFSDGVHIGFMPPVQDHKRAFENDEGPNTGGMGSYSTGDLLPFMDEKNLEEAHKIIRETIYSMRKDGRPFRGVLYGQFMVTSKGVKIIEFNSRFGDPEAMNVLSLLKTSIVDVLLSVADGNLKSCEFSNENTVVKYLVPDGYPDNPKHDQEITLDRDAIIKSGVGCYYASVYEKDGAIYTSKSRSIGLVGISNSLDEAEIAVENASKLIKGPVWHRTDIGKDFLIQRRIENIKRLRK